MSNIVISGYYGYSNAGDEAMLSAMIDVLTEFDPQAHITVISGNPIDTKKRHGVDAVHRFHLPRISRALAKCDLLISGGGSLFQDVTSWRSLYYYLSIVTMAKALGKPVMLYAQGIGPLRGENARRAMRIIGNRVDVITVRDEGSRRELAELGITRPHIEVTADPVLAIHPANRKLGKTILAKSGVDLDKPIVAFAVREWETKNDYKKALALTADRIIEELGAQVVYLPMQYPCDVEAAKRVRNKSRYKNAIFLEDEYTTTELLSLVGNVDLLVGIRLHALIFAGVMQVPMIGISYDPKIDRFMESVGGDCVADLEHITSDALMESVCAKWKTRHLSDVKTELAVSDLRRLAERNAVLALDFLR